MSIQFFKDMDTTFVLEIQSYLLANDAENCVLVCKTVLMRFQHIHYELTLGYPIAVIVKDAGKFWKDFDLDFQLKNREKWDDLAKTYRLKELCFN